MTELYRDVSGSEVVLLGDFWMGTHIVFSTNHVLLCSCLHQCQDELSTHMKTQTGHFTVEELAGALDEMCLRTDKTQMESFIQRSLTLTGRNLITLHSSARILKSS